MYQMYQWPSECECWCMCTFLWGTCASGCVFVHVNELHKSLLSHVFRMYYDVCARKRSTKPRSSFFPCLPCARICVCIQAGGMEIDCIKFNLHACRCQTIISTIHTKIYFRLLSSPHLRMNSLYDFSSTAIIHWLKQHAYNHLNHHGCNCTFSRKSAVAIQKKKFS